MGLLGKIKSKSINDVVNHFKSKSKLKKSLIAREKIVSEYLKSTQTPKLQLGCGHCPMEGWLNTDLDPDPKVAFLDAGGKYPFENNIFHFIFCEHLFEHLTFEQEMILLKECHRTLKPKGILRIAMPNLDFLFQLNNGGEVEKRYINHAINNLWNLKGVKSTLAESDYSSPFVVSNFFKDWGHQIIHNKTSITSMILKAGFSKITFKSVGESDYNELRNIEQHGKIIGDEFNLLESFVMEVEK